MKRFLLYIINNTPTYLFYAGLIICIIIFTGALLSSGALLGYKFPLRFHTCKTEEKIEQLRVGVKQLEIARNIDLAFWQTDKLLERVCLKNSDIYVALTHSNMPKNKLVGTDFKKTVDQIEKEVKRVLKDSINVHVYFCAKDRIPVLYSKGAWSATSYEHLQNSFKKE